MVFWRRDDGNIAITAALTLPLLLAFAGLGLDFQRYAASRTKLQELADALALRGARELTLANADPATIVSMLRSAAEGEIGQAANVGPANFSGAVDVDKAAVTVTLTQPAPKALILSHVARYGGELAADATAVARGGQNVCVIALQAEGAAIEASKKAELEAGACALLSNSTDVRGLIAADQSAFTARFICSAGGYVGSPTNFPSAMPMTDCPAYDDPLADRPPPPVGGCDHTDYEVGVVNANPSAGAAAVITTRLSPGVYCGGLRILARADVTFDPGVYVIKDGQLLVGKSSTLQGDGVGFYLAGDQSTFTFDKNAKIDLTAPRSGPLAGVLFFEDRNAPLGRTHAIYSDDARQLLGTIYLPRGELLIDTTKPVADASAYTAIVVRRLQLAHQSKIVINANYTLTDVPTPTGVGPVGADVYLRD